MDDGWLRRAIEAKRDGGALDAATWARIIAGYVSGDIDDAPMAALAMACAIRGMADEEIVALTDAMIRSGDVLEIHTDGVAVDKHSSGGVGDTVSLIVVPLVAACGVPVAKLSGRALGHTGGTLDKLEAIPGVRTDLSPHEFVAQVERIGCAIAAQSERLVPADRKLYALRDRTGTVPSIGLIAASIVSKKIASGAGAIVFDVKVGSGAFMRTRTDALALAELLVRLTHPISARVPKPSKRATFCVATCAMCVWPISQPLSRTKCCASAELPKTRLPRVTKQR
jgi:pyrimidine-nucleoside phosphorylase